MKKTSYFSNMQRRKKYEEDVSSSLVSVRKEGGYGNEIREISEKTDSIIISNIDEEEAKNFEN